MATAFPYNSTTPVNSQGFAFNVEQLREEILADAGITTELGQIVGSGTEDIEVQFIAALSGAEETALNAVVAAHVPSDYGIIVEGLTGEEGSGNVALASAELNWFNNENTIFESHTVQDVIEEISSLSWLQNVDLGVLEAAPILGNPGELGTTGETGAQGPQGNTGPIGDAGPSGNTGVSGATGSDGLVGSTGSAGNTGVAGATGEDGFVGSDGALGATGPAGATGEGGSTGAGAAPDYFVESTNKTTNKQTWKQYTNWATPSLVGGTYRFAWHLSYRIEGDEASDIRIRDDDTTTLVNIRVDKPNDLSLEQHISGFDFVTLSAGSHTIDMDRRIDGDDSTIKIFSARFELVKVG